MNPDILINKFKEYGYVNSSQLANELVEQGIYSKKSNVRAYIHQVINGSRNPSLELIKGLVKICNNDPEVENMLFIFKDENVPEVKKSFNSLMIAVRNLSEERKSKALIDIKKFFDDYHSRLKY